MVVCRPRLNGGSTPRRLMISTRRLTSVTPVRGMAVSAILALSLLSLWATAQAPPAKNAAPAATKPVAAPEADEPPLNFDPRPVNLQQVDGGQVWTAAFSPDGKMLAVGTGGASTAQGGTDIPGALKIWNVATRKEVMSFPERLSVRSVAYSLDGRLLATGLFDKTVKVRDART